MYGKRVMTFALLLIGILFLFFLNIATGSVSIPMKDVSAILTGSFTGRASWQYIIMETRLPQAITAMLCGAALSVSGLMLQTAFRNPLAAPDIFGINAGAGLGVALVMLLWGGSLVTDTFSFTGFMAILLAAFIGAILVTLLILFFSSIVGNVLLLLIIGVMTGYVASSAITILNYFASEEGVKSFVLWGMGSFSGVSGAYLPAFTLVSVAGMAASFLLIKPLNALLLGDEYASNLGINTRLTRNLLLVTTGLLTAVTTAFCGPVAFISLAVPHITRLLLRSSDHRILLPATLLCGAFIALLCNVVCSLPGNGEVIPINAITPLIGAPVIIYVIVKRK